MTGADRQTRQSPWISACDRSADVPARVGTRPARAAARLIKRDAVFLVDRATGRMAGLDNDGERVVIVGAGLVGALAAIYMARLGYRVDVYDKRPGMCGGRSDLSPLQRPIFIITTRGRCAQ